MTDTIPIILDNLPYWRVAIRPWEYRDDRITSARECFDILESIAVRAGGWRYPFVSRDRDRMHIRRDHAEAVVNEHEFREFARLYRSGQFLYVAVLREAASNHALAEASRIYRHREPRGSTEPTGGVNIVRMMRLVSVAFLNLQSLVERLHLDCAVQMSLRLANINRYALVAGTERQMDELYQAADEAVEIETAFNPKDLRVKPLELAVAVSRDIYAGFGWLDPMDFVLDGIQEEALK
ncbi:MAG: hypothetical protein JO270_18450 [Acidobacteriaceae bacterium]|nr:hypothetical protein [Acidobacteriaceae bacterium]MBV8582218.1 hypothetical protein [Candidatus Eremiobacteraeota bacterium]